jgi:hypothetical protein
MRILRALHGLKKKISPTVQKMAQRYATIAPHKTPLRDGGSQCGLATNTTVHAMAYSQRNAMMILLILLSFTASGGFGERGCLNQLNVQTLCRLSSLLVPTEVGGDYD